MLQNSQENICVGVSFIKVAGLHLLQNTSGQLLWEQNAI